MRVDSAVCFSLLTIASGRDRQKRYRLQDRVAVRRVGLVAETEAELRAVASPFRTAQAFGVEDIVDPRETPPTCAVSSMRRRAASGPSSGPNRSMACGHELPYREFQ